MTPARAVEWPWPPVGAASPQGPLVFARHAARRARDDSARAVAAIVDPARHQVWGRVSAETCHVREEVDWAVLSSAIHDSLLRQGWGGRLYLELFAAIVELDGPAIIGSDACCGGGTSEHAFAMWRRLVPLFPRGRVGPDSYAYDGGRCASLVANPASVQAAIARWRTPTLGGWR